MIQTNQQTLNEFIDILMLLENNVYTTPCDLLTNATIGEHTRHIIELYQCLLNGYPNAEVSYDKRKRDVKIERNKLFAISQIDNIVQLLDRPNKELTIEYEFNGVVARLASNYYREVMYNLEHTIHHQALIKVAVNQLSQLILPPSFGVAPSTLQFRKQCAH